MVANISPASDSYSETASTLRYAERTKLVRNRAVVNDVELGQRDARRRGREGQKGVLSQRCQVSHGVTGERSRSSRRALFDLDERWSLCLKDTNS